MVVIFRCFTWLTCAYFVIVSVIITVVAIKFNSKVNFCFKCMSSFALADIVSGNTYACGNEGYRRDDESQKSKFSREALAELLKVVESRVYSR